MRLSRLALLVVLLSAAAFSACATVLGPQKMRVVNSGPNAITNLHVLFPDQDVAFGDVAPNATTEYKAFPKGVYSYAAYKYDLNGAAVMQPVIDWVGESPMEGREFTYTIQFDPNASAMQRIQMLNVARDQ